MKLKTRIPLLYPSTSITKPNKLGLVFNKNDSNRLIVKLVLKPILKNKISFKITTIFVLKQKAILKYTFVI